MVSNLVYFCSLWYSIIRKSQVTEIRRWYAWNFCNLDLDYEHQWKSPSWKVRFALNLIIDHGNKLYLVGEARAPQQLVLTIISGFLWCHGFSLPWHYTLRKLCITCYCAWTLVKIGEDIPRRKILLELWS